MQKLFKFSAQPLLLAVIAQIFSPMVSYAAISNLPPLVRTNVPPNIFYTLDDSGSMMFEVMPENLTPIGDGSDGNRQDIYSYCGTSNQCWVVNTFPRPKNVYNINGYGDYSATLSATVGFDDNITVARWRSSDVNQLYYDPNVLYQPWADPAGGSMPDANPHAAKFNPVAPIGGSNDIVIDLGVNQTVGAHTSPISTRWLNSAADGLDSTYATPRTFYPALYYVYNGGTGCDTSTLTCFTRYEIKAGTTFPAKGSARTDCPGSSCTVDQELQNFANWFQYHRSRILTARGGSGQAFSRQNSSIRVGFGTINTDGTVIYKVSDDFSATNKSNFLTALYSQRMPAAGTPLRQAIDDIGQYFSDTSTTGPWQTQNGVGSSSTQVSCRQNYNILMTDGYWNGNSANGGRTGNYDGTNGPTISGPNSQSYRYTPVHPYSDNESSTLADIAFYYWSRDLRPDWPAAKKNVPSSNADPAFWQHLVQFTVGLGVKGVLDPDTDLPALTDGTKSWPTAASNQVDDLWHAAVNSRGQYFSAGNPTQFANALNAALGTIANRVGDAAAIGTSSNSVRSGASVFTSTYKSADWSGQLQQKNLDINGNIVSNGWTAALPTGTRNVFTYVDAVQKGKAFTYSNLATADKAYFDTAANSYTGITGENIVNYIVGGSDLGKLRPRTSPFGDFVNSAPQYLQSGDDEGYAFLPANTPGKSDYNAYITSTKVHRQSMVYIGGNDGMLHAFNGSTGVEEFAYVPKSVMSNLPSLASPTYTHKFFVDGIPNMGDFYDGGWKTVLVGATGAGARAIFALDITSPTSFDASKVMWEVNSTNDSDIGYTIGTPQIGRAPNGDWVAVFGNGYQSDAKHAVLFIVKLSDGSITKVDTGIGSASVPNGLATPRLLLGSDATIKAAYAGDLQGNLWKFDFAATGVTKAFSGSPLFQAKKGSIVQPITVQPDLVPHLNGGYMIVFGTGKVFEDFDATNTDVQSMYGIWDNTGAPNITATAITGSQSSLQQQTLTAQSGSFYSVSNNPVDWTTKRGWYIDLNLSTGERVTIDPQIFFDQVVFTTIIPSSSTDPCSADGKSTTFVLRTLTGGPLPYNVFDTNGNGVINVSDASYSGKQSDLTFGTTIIRTKDGAVIIQPKASGGSSDPAGGSTKSDIATTPTPTLRLWRQILGKD